MSPSAVALETQGIDVATTHKVLVSTSAEASIPTTIVGEANSDILAQDASSMPYRSTPQPDFEIEDHPIDIIKPIKVCNLINSNFPFLAY